MGFISRRQDGSNPQNNVLYHISIMKDERISVDAENTSNKIQQPFMIKILKGGIEETYLNIMKTIYKKTHR